MYNVQMVEQIQRNSLKNEEDIRKPLDGDAIL